MSMEYNFNAQQAFTIEEGRKVFQLSSEEINAIFADSGSFEVGEVLVCHRQGQSYVLVFYLDF